MQGPIRKAHQDRRLDQLSSAPPLHAQPAKSSVRFNPLPDIVLHPLWMSMAGPRGPVKRGGQNCDFFVAA